MDGARHGVCVRDATAFKHGRRAPLVPLPVKVDLVEGVAALLSELLADGKVVDMSVPADMFDPQVVAQNIEGFHRSLQSQGLQLPPQPEASFEADFTLGAGDDYGVDEEVTQSEQVRVEEGFRGARGAFAAGFLSRTGAVHHTAAGGKRPCASCLHKPAIISCHTCPWGGSAYYLCEECDARVHQLAWCHQRILHVPAVLDAVTGVASLWVATGCERPPGDDIPVGAPLALSSNLVVVQASQPVDGVPPFKVVMQREYGLRWHGTRWAGAKRGGEGWVASWPAKRCSPSTRPTSHAYRPCMQCIHFPSCRRSRAQPADCWTGQLT
jgi:hypothetical protein